MAYLHASDDKQEHTVRQRLNQHSSLLSFSKTVQDFSKGLMLEYQSETIKQMRVLAALGFTGPQHNLSVECHDNMLALAGVANELGLSTVVTEAAMSAAWSQLSMDDMKISRLQMMLSHKAAELERLYKRAEASRQQLDTAMKVAKEKLSRADKHMNAMALKYLPEMPAKLQKYRDQEACFQAELDRLGLRPELKHWSLVELHGELEEALQKQADVKAELDTYHNLPCSEEEARLQVKVMRDNLAALHKVLHAGLGLEG
ncbi:hypothetical protein CEUSTIGMA_g12433.t1 [Chlamydomonas eustigma]|uniref:Uncharacterized protein n=1 Tax=Chlamydomonas eustigma TaxID=1157962 RepID=A0A250XQ08_9CHLO|nr:hypothetical protein CEUSTIGMA_g12433.t1 [Chlamydomonas eustigma]|eukprot:GAX85012.1 hypothetical protein CEUSTIGMA_g12433.t1 [Chlamydomonas eustigma]